MCHAPWDLNATRTPVSMENALQKLARLLLNQEIRGVRGKIARLMINA